MKVDKRLVPLKAHYFCFLGCVSPIFPFLIVLGVQLGIPVSVTGTLSAVSLLLVVFTKPIVATLADAFPSFRRLIFIATLFVMVACFSSIYFVTPMREVLRVEGQMVKAAAVVVGGGNRDEGRNSLHKDVYTARSAGTSGTSPSVVTLAGEDVAGDQLVLLARGEADDCYVGVAWDCVVSCRRQPGACVLPSTTTSNTTSNTTTTQPVINLKALDGDQGLQMLQGIRETLDAHYTLEGGLFEGLPAMGDVLLEEEDSARRRVYKLEGFKGPWDSLVTNVSVECHGGQWAGSGCPGAWSYWAFWTFAILLCIGQCAFNTAASITDAIIVDIIGEDGDYGLQRAWGTVGWGLMGPVSGLLIDWWSGTAVTKNYSPAFLLCFLLGTTDVILSTSCIKVPQIKTDHNILKKVWPVLRQPKVFIFCCFVIMNGIFDGVVASFIFM